jgi:hypothetical protein
MNYSGQVTYYNSSDHSFLVNFSLSKENLSVASGSAHVRINVADARIDIESDTSVDSKTYDYLSSKFLETIYNYNVCHNSKFFSQKHNELFKGCLTAHTSF